MTLELQSPEHRSKEMEAHLLDADTIKMYWPQIVGMLERVPHTWSVYTLESLYCRALNGDMQIWVVGRDSIVMVVFTQVATYPAKRLLEIVWAGGNKVIPDSLPILDATLERFAELQKCDEMLVLGRSGWERVLKSIGFRRHSVVLSRPVASRRTQ